jgi:hypothetical protein
VGFMIGCDQQTAFELHTYITGPRNVQHDDRGAHSLSRLVTNTEVVWQDAPV